MLGPGTGPAAVTPPEGRHTRRIEPDPGRRIADPAATTGTICAFDDLAAPEGARRDLEASEFRHPSSTITTPGTDLRADLMSGLTG